MRRLLMHNRLLGATLALVGIGVIWYLLRVQDLPPLGSLGFFVILAFYVDWRSVGIGWKVRMSANAMVTLAAGIAFHRTGAVLAMVLVSVVGVVGPIDIRERRVFYPAANLGQLVITPAVSGVALSAILDDGRPTLGRAIVAAAFAGIVYVGVNAGLVVSINRLTGLGLNRSDIKRILVIIPPYLVLSILGGLLGATYLFVGAESLPFIGVMILMSNGAAVSYGALMEARESTIRGFSKALEARDIFSRGHAERTMDFAEMIAREFGYDDEHVERLRLAALLSDVSSLAVPRDLIDHEADLTEEEEHQISAYMVTIDEMLAQVDFLKPSVDIARQRLLSRLSPFPPGRGLDAHVIAVAKRFDQLTTGTGRAEAVTHDEALSDLRNDRRRMFDPGVVDALAEATERRGLRFGRVILDHVPTAEEIAMRRMYERQ